MNKIQCPQGHFYEPAFEEDQTCSHCVTVNRNIFDSKSGDNNTQSVTPEFADLNIKKGVKHSGVRKTQLTYHVDHIYCGNCFTILNGYIDKPCHNCGYIERDRNTTALASGVILNNHFLVGRLLNKAGDFGITYLCWDVQMGGKVAIKEFFPKDSAYRSIENNRSEISVFDKKKQKSFLIQRDEFLKEAKVLNKIYHPTIVNCTQYFSENNTAYIVMSYYSGHTLAELINKQGAISYDDSINILWPIMGGLRELHHLNIFHRDINPENILIAKNGQPILLNFGNTQLEPYSNKENKMGVWADIHALCTLMYYCITGARAKDTQKYTIESNTLQSVESFSLNMPDLMQSIIHNGMKVQQNNPYPSVKSLQVALKLLRPQQLGSYIWQENVGNGYFGQQMRAIQHATTHSKVSPLIFSLTAAIFQWFWLFSYRLTKYGIASLLVTMLTAFILAYNNELWPYSVLISLLNGVACGFFGLLARYHYINQWSKNQPVSTLFERVETTKSLLSLNKPTYAKASIGLIVCILFMLAIFAKQTYETGIREQVSMALRLENLRQQVREFHDQTGEQKNPRLDTLD